MEARSSKATRKTTAPASLSTADPLCCVDGELIIVALTPAVAALARIARAIRNAAPSPQAGRCDASPCPETTA
ncbi:MAG: hypothetical protein WB609_09835, partial [Candidatus Cybelea sp.]